MSLKSILQKALPNPVRDRIRPLYRRVFQKPFIPNLEIGEFGGLEIAYRSHSHDKLLIDVVLTGENFLLGLPEYHLSADHTVIDVGAHIGAFAVSTAAKLTSGRLFAVEACRETFNLLRINIALNGLKNVIPVRVRCPITTANAPCTTTPTAGAIRSWPTSRTSARLSRPCRWRASSTPTRSRPAT